jgi:hypothetical protein
MDYIMKRHKLFKYIKIVILLIFILVFYPFGKSVVNKFKYGHSSDTINKVDKNFIFKDYIFYDFDSFVSTYYRDEDNLNYYNYQKDSIDFVITVWEFNDAEQILNNKIFIKRRNLRNIYFKDFEILSMDSDFEKYVNFGFKFDNDFTVNFDVTDSSLQKYKGEMYQGVFGKFSRISLSNKGKHQILLENTSDQILTSLVVFKKKNSIFLVLINANKEFNSDIVNILNIR